MKSLLLAVSLLLSAASGLAASNDDLEIDVTFGVECERKSQSGDRIEVHYRGRLASNGEEFDASYKRGSPFGFKLGGGQVIKGWDEGLVDMCIGEKRTLTIKPSMGYGQRAMGSIPAGSTLIFETELTGISGVPTPEKIIPKEVKDDVEQGAQAAKEKADEAKEEVKENVKEEVKEAAGDAKSGAEDAAVTASSAAEDASQAVGDKIASVAGDAAKAAKTFFADNDDSQEHNEL